MITKPVRYKWYSQIEFTTSSYILNAKRFFPNLIEVDSSKWRNKNIIQKCFNDYDITISMNS